MAAGAHVKEQEQEVTREQGLWEAGPWWPASVPADPGVQSDP